MNLSNIAAEVSFAFCVGSVAFRFWTVFSFSGSLPVMLFAFFYSDKHPVVFFVNASAKQSFNRQESHPFMQVQQYIHNISHQLLIMISLEKQLIS
jgi:hypothetical protein